MVIHNDLKYMQQALDLSLKGAGWVNPNPLVGAVLVKDNQVVGAGYHQEFGGKHAEVNAIEAAGADARNATLYVTLEPCNHHGKTPPCTQRIISEGISRVVIGMKDPNPGVVGNGIETLREAGIEVEQGVLAEEIIRTNEAFITFIKDKRPFVSMKTAMSIDGKIASRNGDSRWITNKRSREFVHELRHINAAIMVGVDTVIKDDPELTDRSGHSRKSHPIRIVADSRGRIPLTARVLDTTKAPTLIATTSHMPEKKKKELEERGAGIIICPQRDDRVDLSFLMQHLAEQGIDSVLLEGGGNLNFSALRQGIVDKVFAFIAPLIIGGKNAISPVEGDGFEKLADGTRLYIEQVSEFDGDVLIEAYTRRN